MLVSLLSRTCPHRASSLSECMYQYPFLRNKPHMLRVYHLHFLCVYIKDAEAWLEILPSLIGPFFFSLISPQISLVPQTPAFLWNTHPSPRAFPLQTPTTSETRQSLQTPPVFPSGVSSPQTSTPSQPPLGRPQQTSTSSRPPFLPSDVPSPQTLLCAPPTFPQTLLFVP